MAHQPLIPPPPPQQPRGLGKQSASSFSQSDISFGDAAFDELYLPNMFDLSETNLPTAGQHVPGDAQRVALQNSIAVLGQSINGITTALAPSASGAGRVDYTTIHPSLLQLHAAYQMVDGSFEQMASGAEEQASQMGPALQKLEKLERVCLKQREELQKANVLVADSNRRLRSASQQLTIAETERRTLTAENQALHGENAALTAQVAKLTAVLTRVYEAQQQGRMSPVVPNEYYEYQSRNNLASPPALSPHPTQFANQSFTNIPHGAQVNLSDLRTNPAPKAKIGMDVPVVGVLCGGVSTGATAVAFSTELPILSAVFVTTTLVSSGLWLWGKRGKS